ncbi:MAG TPA: ATP-binding protein [Gemmataceae bacterium]|nr:ATP-binding protein [Gemmataceae bacterium]
MTPSSPLTNVPGPPTALPAASDQLSLPEVFRRVCEAAADALRVERVGIWLLVHNDKTLRCVNLFERSKRQHSKGATLQVGDFPGYFRAVAGLPALPTVCAREDPRTADLRDAYLEPLGISSMLDAPLIRDGRMIGVVCHEQVGPPREWTAADRDYARSVADLVVARMKAAEAQLIRSVPGEVERAEVIGRLAAGVAHDFKNLLMVILGNATLIARRIGLPADVAVCAAQIADAADRGNTLVRELLDFGRESAGAPRVLNVPDAVAGFVHLLRAAAGPRHQVEYTRDGAPGRVLIDRGQLERAVLNLVLNARDAMPGGGTIRIHAAADQASDGDGPPGAYVRLDVHDTGAGIDPADVDRIFEPFFTTKADGHGTGLGLAVVRRAVDLAGGFVRVDSERGKGTTFRLYFPRVTGEG